MTTNIEKSSGNTNTRKAKKDFPGKYFIKDLENITGIKVYTIRIWEQRFGIIKPCRTDTNIRYYEESEVKHVMNVAILHNNGYKISKIAKMTRDEVMKRALNSHETSSKYDSQIQALSNAMLDFNEREFNKILSINILKIGMEDTMTDIIFPFMDNVGLLWAAGSIHPAHEHFITNLIRQRFYVSIDQLSYQTPRGGKTYLLFVPNGEPHDLSLLFASYMLRSRGQNVIYLGTSTPIDDLAKIFELRKPDFLFCSLTNPNTGVPTQVLLNRLSKEWPDTKLLITGQQVVKRKDLNIPKNCIVIGSPWEFAKWIESNT